MNSAPAKRQIVAAKQMHYHAYLLRMWRNDEATPWRASLHSVANERLHHFADIDALFNFLLAQLEGNEPQWPDADDAPDDVMTN